MASPPSQQFVPKLLTILLTMLVLGVLWNFIYGQIIRTFRENPEVPSPAADTASLSPEVAPPPPAIPPQPNVPNTSLSGEEKLPARVIEPLQQLTLPEEAHEHRGLTVSCKVELKRLCAEVPPGGGRLKRCYRERENQLSPPCQQQVEEQAAIQRVAHQRITVRCAGDVRKFCANVHVGGGQKQQCLEDHYRDLSQDCYQALEQRITPN